MKKIKILAVVIVAILVAAIAIPVSALGFLYLYPGVGNSPDSSMREEYAARATNFDGMYFSNEQETFMQMNGREERSGRAVPEDTIPVVYSKSIEQGTAGKLFVTWFGHSSSLVQLGDKNILIDPILTDYSSPVGFAGVKRFSDVAIDPGNLPEIDFLLLSHDHYDHMDYQTIKMIDKKVKNYVVPLGVEARLKGWGIAPEKIHTVCWWEEFERDGVTFTSIPTHHSSGRNPFEMRRTLWCGFFFKDADHSVYYTGDGGYCDVFEKVREICGSPDLALMECGQYGKNWPKIHMFPEQTVQASKDLGAKWVIPVHWGAFCISNNAWDDSIIRFTNGAAAEGINEATPRIGERVDFDEIGNYQEHWWEGLN